MSTSSAPRRLIPNLWSRRSGETGPSFRVPSTVIKGNRHYDVDVPGFADWRHGRSSGDSASCNPTACSRFRGLTCKRAGSRGTSGSAALMSGNQGLGSGAVPGFVDRVRSSWHQSTKPGAQSTKPRTSTYEVRGVRFLLMPRARGRIASRRLSLYTLTTAMCGAHASGSAWMGSGARSRRPVDSAGRCG